MLPTGHREGVFFPALADPSREIYREGLCGVVFVPSLADPSQDVGGSVCVLYVSLLVDPYRM